MPSLAQKVAEKEAKEAKEAIFQKPTLGSAVRHQEEKPSRPTLGQAVQVGD